VFSLVISPERFPVLMPANLLPEIGPHKDDSTQSSWGRPPYTNLSRI